MVQTTTNGMTARWVALAALAAGGLLLAGCGVQSPQVGSVDLRSGGTVPGSPFPNPPFPSPPPQEPGSPGAGGSDALGLDGEYPVQLGPAGTATFVVRGNQVSLQDVALEPGWQQTAERPDDEGVELRFGDGTSTVQVEAELDDGRFETDVDVDTPLAPGEVTYPVADAGSVTVDISPTGVGLVSQEAASGWVATVDSEDLRRGNVEIHFRNDGASRSVEFDAEVERGDMLNIDIDSKTGNDHFVRGPGR